MKLKDNSVNLVDLHPKLQLILPFVDRWCKANLGYDLTITSACDGKHSAHSRHYWGGAFDARTWTTETSGRQITQNRKNTLAADLRHELASKFGPYYQVLPEATHFHIAFKPNEAVTMAHLV